MVQKLQKSIAFESWKWVWAASLLYTICLIHSVTLNSKNIQNNNVSVTTYLYPCRHRKGKNEPWACARIHLASLSQLPWSFHLTRLQNHTVNSMAHQNYWQRLFMQLAAHTTVSVTQPVGQHIDWWKRWVTEGREERQEIQRGKKEISSHCWRKSSLLEEDLRGI